MKKLSIPVFLICALSGGHVFCKTSDFASEIPNLTWSRLMKEDSLDRNTILDLLSTPRKISRELDFFEQDSPPVPVNDPKSPSYFFYGVGAVTLIVGSLSLASNYWNYPLLPKDSQGFYRSHLGVVGMTAGLYSFLTGYLLNHPS